MRPKRNKEFGFDILTETTRQNDDDDSDSYELGQSTKQHDKPYTDDAIILQSILEYSETFGCENYFKSRKISENHLLINCDYYIKLYQGNEAKTNKKVRIENINNRVVESLEKLAYLELIDIDECTAKNKEPTEKYRFTKFGRLIGLLFLFEKRKEIIIPQFLDMYKQIFDFYYTLNHSHAKLCLIFFEVCYFRGKFHQIILSLAELLKNANDDKNLFLNQLRFLNLIYRDLEMWDIFKSSLSLLRIDDILTYNIILFNLKLTIEEIHEVKARNLKDYEVYRLGKKQDIDKVVVEGFCNTCKRFFTVSIKTLYYLDSYITSFVSNKYDDNFKCRLCNKDYWDFQTIVDI